MPSGALSDEALAQLQKLADLQRAGVITQQEFVAKKKSLRRSKFWVCDSVGLEG